MFNFQSISVKGPVTGGNAGDVVNVDITLTAHAALAAGQVVALPGPTPAGTGAGVNAYIPSSGQTTTATEDMCEIVGKRRIFGVVLAAAASGAPVTVRVRGACQALMTLGMTSVNYGGGCLTVGATTAGSLTNLAAGATNTEYQLALAIPLEATGTAAALKYVLFDGISGFGSTGEAV